MKGPSQDPASQGEGMGLEQKEQGQNWGMVRKVERPRKGGELHREGSFMAESMALASSLEREGGRNH